MHFPIRPALFSRKLWQEYEKSNFPIYCELSIFAYLHQIYFKMSCLLCSQKVKNGHYSLISEVEVLLNFHFIVFSVHQMTKQMSHVDTRKTSKQLVWHFCFVTYIYNASSRIMVHLYNVCPQLKWGQNPNDNCCNKLTTVAVTSTSKVTCSHWGLHTGMQLSQVYTETAPLLPSMLRPGSSLPALLLN